MNNIDAIRDTYGGIGMVIAIVLLIWAVLLFFMPFYVYGAWVRAKQCSQRLDLLLERADAAMAQRKATNAQLALLVTIAEQQSAIDADDVP